MRKHMIKLSAATLALTAMTISLPAFAAEEPAAEEEASGPIDLSGTVTLVSDYRFRGVSLSGKDPALQASLNIAHESGVYAGVWASTIAENDGDDLEVDLYAGFAGGDAVTFDLGATYYVYPGISSLNYVETTGKIGTTVGPATLGAQVSYAPRQNSIGGTDNLYLATTASVGIPNTPLTVAGSFGYEDGAFGGETGNKLDWSLGVTASFDALTIGASYIDSNRNSIFVDGDARKAIVATVGLSF